MLSTPRHKHLFELNSAVISLGVLFLVWFYLLDGVYINRPITYIRGVNPESLALVSDVYEVGETPQYYTSFCKNRAASVAIEWSLIDGQRVLYGPTEPRSLPVGCYPFNGGFLITDLKRIPEYIEPTCDAYFVGDGRVTISGGRVIEYKYRTQKFCITNSKQKE